MIAQEFIKWDQYVRCMCLGRDTVLPMPYDTQQPQVHRRTRTTSRRR